MDDIKYVSQAVGKKIWEVDTVDDYLDQGCTRRGPPFCLMKPALRLESGT